MLTVTAADATVNAASNLTNVLQDTTKENIGHTATAAALVDNFQQAAMKTTEQQTEKTTICVLLSKAALDLRVEDCSHPPRQHKATLNMIVVSTAEPPKQTSHVIIQKENEHKDCPNVPAWNIQARQLHQTITKEVALMMLDVKKCKLKQQSFTQEHSH